MKNFLIISTLLLLFTSCGEEKKDAVVSQSPNGNITLKVSGKRESALSAWNTNLVATGKGLEGNINFEFYGKDLNDETVKFEWEGDSKCTIRFIQRDDTERVFEFTPGAGAVMWRDVSKK